MTNSVSKLSASRASFASTPLRAGSPACAALGVGMTGLGVEPTPLSEKTSSANERPALGVAREERELGRSDLVDIGLGEHFHAVE